MQISRTSSTFPAAGRCDLSDFVGTAALAAKPRPSATHLISSTISPAVIAPLWLRPGSGCLRVFLYLDGVTRVLRIEDAADASSLLETSQLPANVTVPEQLNPARWGTPLFIERFLKASGRMCSTLFLLVSIPCSFAWNPHLIDSVLEVRKLQ